MSDHRKPKLAILTRPQGQSQSLGLQLANLGWEVLDWPALALATRSASDMPELESFDLVVFVSGNAVRHFAEQRRMRGEFSWPSHLPVAVVGPSSAAACAVLGPSVSIIQPSADSQSFDSEALWAEVLKRDLQSSRVLVVRGGEGSQGVGRGWLAERWLERGAEVVLYSAYTRGPAFWPLERQQYLCSLDRGVQGTWLWSSAEGIAAVAQQWGESTLARTWVGSRLICTHPRVAQVAAEVARRHGVRVAERGLQQPADLVLQVCLPQEAAVLAAFVN